MAPYDILHRGGIEVKTASISLEERVLGAHGLPVLADSRLEKIEALPFDILILPGGGEGTKNLRNSLPVKNLIVASYNAGKTIAAICAAPSVLANAGILQNHEATSYPSVRENVEPHCKKYLEEPVVASKNIITSRGAGTAAEFGFCLLSLLAGNEVSADVREKMLF